MNSHEPNQTLEVKEGVILSKEGVPLTDDPITDRRDWRSQGTWSGAKVKTFVWKPHTFSGLLVAVGVAVLLVAGLSVLSVLALVLLAVWCLRSLMRVLLGRG